MKTGNIENIRTWLGAALTAKLGSSLSAKMGSSLTKWSDKALTAGLAKVLSAVLCVLGLASCSSDKPDNFEPQLQTLEAIDITRNEATMVGQCHTTGSTETPQLWFCYGDDPSMSQKTAVLTPADNNGGKPDGTVVYRLNQLTPSTTYYYKLQGGSSNVVLSGEQLSFTTQPNAKPTAGEVTVLGISPLSAIVSYSISETGGDPITESGCYLSRQDGGTMGDATTSTGSTKSGSTSSGSTSDGSVSTGSGNTIKLVHTGDADDNGMFRLRIGGLQPEVAYSIRPFAANKNGEDVGEAVSFVTTSTSIINDAGQLTELVGDDKYRFTTLSIAGVLNGDDLRTLRDMAGCDNEGKATAGQLSDIDLSGAQIAEGGKAYAEGHFTQTNVVGKAMLASCEKLKRIVLPLQTTKIEADAFRNCSSLHTIEVPTLVESIETSAGCTALAEINVQAGNNHYSSKDGVLLSGDGKSILWFPMGKEGEYTLPSTVTTVGDYAFRNCRIETFHFADGLTSIGKYAFYNSSVKEVSLPSTVKQIPTGLFQKCADLTTVHLGKNTELLGDYVFDGCPITNLYISAPTPPYCSNNTFASSGNNIFSTCRVHVPKNRRIYYRGDVIWAQFKRIVEEESLKAFLKVKK